ncbi:MAG: hypothetical protein HUK40_00940 [Desulfobacter sp.]|nr:hypothetical protein [Desulfobacter sp.]WDP85609.1 MAG: hypothetical protein HUN05_11100 [Desulfobacter sp.]
MTANRQTGLSAKTSRLYDVSAALLAFICWGGWAFFINYSAGVVTGLISGLTQGTVSMIMTLVMIKIVTGMFHLIANHMMQLVMPTLFTVGGAAGLLVLMHSLVGTPNIFWTILPGLSGAVPFCFYTSYKLQLAAR